MKSLLFLAAAMSGSAASADDIAFKPLLDARLRYEGVDQDGLPSEPML